MSKYYKIETKRGTGPGGQHKNKTESCVKVTDIETGISETCQETRSQQKNKKTATQRLNKRLRILRQENLNKAQNLHRRDQINNPDTLKRRRTYNFLTNTVKDHRTNKTASLKEILNGNIDLLR